MIAVIFEVWPSKGQRDTYLELAEVLARELDAVDGFISIERFESLSSPGKLLSLSFWRDEASVSMWRNLPAHRTTQAKGIESVFTDYRLRVADVVRDYGMYQRDHAPDDSRMVHGSVPVPSEEVL